MSKKVKKDVSMRISGFTLIELLVVISIIALLLSILMPSLKKVKDIARKVVCSSNLRSVGMAALMFPQDNDGWLPMLDATKVRISGHKLPHTNYYFVELAPYLGINSHAYIQEAAEPRGGIGWSAAERAGLDAPDVYVCPSVKRTVNKTKPLSYGWNWYGLGYRYEPIYSDNARSWWGPWKVEKIRSSYVTGMLGENAMSYHQDLEKSVARIQWGGEVNPGYVASGKAGYFNYSHRHSGGSSYVCVDGHIEYKKYQDFVENYFVYRYDSPEKSGSILYPNPRRWKYKPSPRPCVPLPPDFGPKIDF